MRSSTPVRRPLVVALLTLTASPACECIGDPKRLVRMNVDAIPKRPLCERIAGLGALAVNAPGDCCQSLYKLSIPCKTCFKPGEDERCSSRTAEDPGRGPPPASSRRGANAGRRSLDPQLRAGGAGLTPRHDLHLPGLQPGGSLTHAGAASLPVDEREGRRHRRRATRPSRSCGLTNGRQA